MYHKKLLQGTKMYRKKIAQGTKMYHKQNGIKQYNSKGLRQFFEKLILLCYRVQKCTTLLDIAIYI